MKFRENKQNNQSVDNGLKENNPVENAPENEVNSEEKTSDNTEESEQPTPEESIEEKQQKEIESLQSALEKEKKEYMFLMADFDNYRKRVVKEKADILKNGAEKAMAGLLPIVDDFERGLEAASKVEDATSIKEGMELIYNKLIKYLESNGVKPMETTGGDFDSDLHEAIATIPAPSEDLKGKVIDTTTKGYMINDKVLRHAKVVVGE